VKNLLKIIYLFLLPNQAIFENSEKDLFSEIGFGSLFLGLKG
jgi:hypothetical protein